MRPTVTAELIGGPLDGKVMDTHLETITITWHTADAFPTETAQPQDVRLRYGCYVPRLVNGCPTFTAASHVRFDWCEDRTE